MKRITFLLMLIVSITISAQNDIDKKTFIYSIKNQDTLRLDKYDLPSITGEKPCVMFVFGGGFTHGSRDRNDYLPYFHFLAQQGYAVVSIDYRLGIKKAMIEKARKEKEGITEKVGNKQFLAMFEGTIAMAVEDLFDATNYVIDHAKEWSINKDMIVASGSSAGAITVLHAEYDICNGGQLSKRLPERFNYAGLISFAGAIFSTKGDLKWNAKLAPMQLFHGDADSNVPYDALRIKVAFIKTPYGFFGSKYIAKQLYQLKSPYYFYNVENATHEIADSPMQQNLDEIKTFIDKFVVGKQHLIVNSEIKQLDKPKLKKNFKIHDYIKANGMNP